MISLLDYGAGNVRSVVNALEPRLTGDDQEDRRLLSAAASLLLPRFLVQDGEQEQ